MRNYKLMSSERHIGGEERVASATRNNKTN